MTSIRPYCIIPWTASAFFSDPFRSSQMDGNSSILQAAMAALQLWSGARQNILVPFGTSASSVFGVRINGATHFLRLTSQSFRSVDDAADELAFLHHLHSQGARVAVPVP